MRPTLTGTTIAATLAASLGALLVIPRASDAADQKVFPGSACVPSASPSERLAPNYSVSGGVFAMEAPSGTTSGAGADISCPIVRDNHSNTTGFKMFVWVNDFWGTSSGADLDKVTCSASVIRVDTTPSPDTYGRIDFETRSTAANATGVKKLDWGTSLATSVVDASYSLDCFLTTYSQLINYRTEEP